MLSYTLSMSKPNTHYFEVKLAISDYRDQVSDPTKLHVKMPVWTPGSYLIREFSRNILDFEATLSDLGRKAKSYKVSKDEWVVETEDSSAIEINYLVYAFEFTVDTSYLDNLHGIINGASVFVYVEGMQKSAGILEVIPFPEWKEVATGLARRSEKRFEFDFPNYDILLDSPIEIGNQKIHKFDLNGIRYEVSIYSAGKFDQVAFVSELRKIVRTTEMVFKDIPYDRYLFLVDFMNDNLFGGLEHLNSTHCIAPLLRLEPPEEYHQLLSLFSHEFFHAWNVKRMRPVGLGPFDYSKETYTKSLWISEGVTSYYDDLLLRRAQVYTVGEYLEAFAQNISQMKSLPGSRWQSAQEASFDSWIKHYKPNENSPNVIFSYYTQGSIIGWMLDMEIRKVTGLSRNLDDVMRKTYQGTFLSEGRGFTDEEFENICVEVSGSESVRRIFRSRVSGRDDVEYEKYLAYAGLKLIPKKEEKGIGFLGVRIKDESGRAIASTILPLSPAELAGLSAGDEVLGINGTRMDKLRITYYLQTHKPGEVVKLSCSRQGSLLDLEARLNEKPVLEFRIAKKDQANDDEKSLFKNWLGALWSEEIKYEDYRIPPTRINVLDYV